MAQFHLLYHLHFSGDIFLQPGQKRLEYTSLSRDGRELSQPSGSLYGWSRPEHSFGPFDRDFASAFDMESATFLETKDRALCSLSYRPLVSWDVYFTWMTTAHENTSACAASIVRLFYSVKVIHSKDVSYLAGIINLWAIAEATCGILAMCLPISPKFFKSLQDAKLWSTLRISLHSFMKSRNEPTSNSETSSDEDIAAKLNRRSTSLKTHFKKYHYVTTNGTELASVSSKASTERNVRADYEVEVVWNFLFLRTMSYCHHARDRCSGPVRSRKSRDVVY